MVVLRVVTPFGLAGTNVLEEYTAFSPEDGGSMFLRNIDTFKQIQTMSLPRRPASTNR
jgi:hypothetical protein